MKKNWLYYEKLTLTTMIRLYCRRNHLSGPALCGSCESLREYALARIDSCRFKARGLVCSHCRVHCYQNEMREKIRKIMAYAGPRMFLAHPLLSLRYLKNKLFYRG